MTQPLPLRGVKHYPGFGSTLPTDKVDRQAALAEQMKRAEQKELELHEKIKERIDYVPGEEGAPEAQ